jgi:hypothetical protein
MLLLICVLLAILPLLGILGIAVSSSLLTVDGLFTSLILLAISATFGGNALAELRRWRARPSAKTGRPTPGRMAVAAGLIERGKVESVQFFEAHVGQPNKSIVTLSDGGESARMLVLEGDMRNALPTGQTVEMTLRKASGYNVLVDVNYG